MITDASIHFGKHVSKLEQKIDVKSESKTLFMQSSCTALPKHREGPIKIDIPIFKPKNECNVIKIIQKEWDREVERLNLKKSLKPKAQLSSNESKFQFSTLNLNGYFRIVGTEWTC